MSIEEVIAVVVSILGVWLTTRRSLWNFPFSFASVGLYAHIFFGVKLYADMLLQIIFAFTLMYGLAQWRRARVADGGIAVTRAPRGEVVGGLTACVVAAVVVGALLATRTDSAAPWVDSALLAGSLLASVSAARRHIESWWLWIVIDAAYVGLYIYKSLYLTATLYAAFVVLAALGLRRWRSALQAQAGAGVGPTATRAAAADAPILGASA